MTGVEAALEQVPLAEAGARLQELAGHVADDGAPVVLTDDRRAPVVALVPLSQLRAVQTEALVELALARLGSAGLDHAAAMAGHGLDERGRRAA